MGTKPLECRNLSPDAYFTRVKVKLAAGEKKICWGWRGGRVDIFNGENRTICICAPVLMAVIMLQSHHCVW